MPRITLRQKLAGVVLLGIQVYIIVYYFFLRGKVGVPHQHLRDAEPVRNIGTRPTCKDKHEKCLEWAETRQCDTNVDYMMKNCPESCLLCDAPDLGEMQGVPLANGDLMPVVGFGTAGLGERTEQAVLHALNVGYRHIDSAQAREWYREDLVGAALRKVLTPATRHRYFLTTKIHPKHLGHTATANQIPQTLRDLGVDYVDLVLLHYPRCFGSLCSSPPEGTWKDSWRALEEHVNRGTVRAIGVSNFGPSELEELLRVADVKPAVVQAHSDPLSPNTVLRGMCHRHGIRFVAYSSLGTQHMMRRGTKHNPVLTNPIVTSIAQKHGVTPTDVVLRWALHTSQVVIPRSSTPHHIESNLHVVSRVNLTGDEVDQINRIAP